LPSSTHAVILAAYRAFAARDLAALRELALPEIELRTMTGVLAHRDEPYRGHEGLAEYLRDVAAVWDELELTASEFHDLNAGGILVFGRVRARRGTTLVDTSNAWLWRLRNGKVESAEVFGDAASAMFLLAGDEGPGG
jgi:ketosteroid isomerase-like protein